MIVVMLALLGVIIYLHVREVKEEQLTKALSPTLDKQEGKRIELKDEHPPNTLSPILVKLSGR